MQTDCDIAIIGAGPVGLALALLLARHGVPPGRIALIDARAPEQAIRDPRSLALSHGSRQILEDIGAWTMPADSIHQIHVSRRGHFGRTLIDRDEYKLPALGYVTRYGLLMAALDARARQLPLRMLRPAQVTGTAEEADQVSLALADGAGLPAALSARIVVQAEGGLFAEQQAKPLRRDYGQTAIVAHVRAAHPVPHRAYERFTDEGPLALLPQEDGYALVWCARPETALGLTALGDAAFLDALHRQFGDRLGRFTSVSARHAYPLGLNAGGVLSQRVAAIGNAAQTLHPVAGQGLNLGLRDAAVLARLLAREQSPAALRRFDDERRADRSLTIRITDAMARVFAGDRQGSWSQATLALGLGLFDTVAPARRLLAEQMMYGRR
ncbi:2-octaprenyl-6-methoxyphenol hydroxylase [Noviherbaspirillum humi]|uniref:2-octaprenyl-6-methoxyphenol hydroxylase n=1 Tax=Noviherbaspirillum humi TaxID=1688639 RepID=A0A239KA73_9BURK|nr:UbiH/UbiF/VisC/COQ6 family ubiquinone biosynthesis hydroxylase [Noviherbaspirillum humi]SNT14668.1 2-octaprenyl-6-methoxyphenol hydroxylase [Noviherbaspirillum humi]